MMLFLSDKLSRMIQIYDKTQQQRRIFTTICVARSENKIQMQLQSSDLVKCLLGYQNDNATLQTVSFFPGEDNLRNTIAWFNKCKSNNNEMNVPKDTVFCLSTRIIDRLALINELADIMMIGAEADLQLWPIMSMVSNEYNETNKVQKVSKMLKPAKYFIFMCY